MKAASHTPNGGAVGDHDDHHEQEETGAHVHGKPEHPERRW